MNKKKHALEIIKRLKEAYPDADCTLDYDDAWKLLVSVRLAAQCTDARVNVVVPKLYEKFPTIQALAEADVDEIEEIVRPCGLGRSKARDISACMKILWEKYDGKVPEDFDALLKLPGVGRKTANCVIVFAFQDAAIPVDTHVHRISNRWGIADTKEPEETEIVLMEKVPKELWVDLNDLMVQFGQTICRPIGPQCDKCPLTDLCDYDASKLE